ncbi:MAG: choice-of-anchor J domain-containing protein, partial [Blastocatellia bacterium]|nr:choice-of-anchor J domain-containing protein [Blastocatellia bacterium]
MLSTFSFRAGGWRKLTTAFFSVAFVAGAIVFSGEAAKAQSFTQDFTTVPAAGWTTQNNSVPVGSTGWFQGNTATFPGQTGGYIGANFNNTTGTNTISNWLISPNATGIQNGHTLKYWTRTVAANPFPDRLQVRMSLAGASTNVGTGNAAVGDFTTLLRDINPLYETGGAYPEVWTEFTDTIAGVASPTSGRFAFRYFVEMGGPTGDNSNYIGLDTVSYTASAPAPVDAPNDINADGKSDFAIVRADGAPLAEFMGANDIAGKDKVGNNLRRQSE